MKKTLLTGCFVALLVMSSAPQLFAQDVEVLLEAVDKIEANLDKMLKQDAATGDQQPVNQKSQIVQTGLKPTDKETKVQLIDIMIELEALRVEIQGLKRTLDDNAKQLVSLDDEGFYSAPKEDQNVDEFSSRLAGLETTLANIAKDGTISNPSVKHGNISFSGMVHEHFVSGQDETSTFESKRARLAVKGDINEYAQIKIHAEFAKSPKLLDGQVTISPNSQWSASVGQYKPPFGTDFLVSATSMPFVNKSMAAGLGTNRDIGGTISFRQKLNPDFSYERTAGMFNGAGINTSDVNDSKNFVARFEATVLEVFTFAPNINAGKTNEINSLKEDLLDIGSSLSWNWGQEIIELEYIRSEHGDIKRSGWYIWGGHMFSIDSKFMPRLQLLVRYEQQDLNLDINNDRTDRVTLGTNIFIDNKYTKIQLNYQINTEQGASISNNEFLMNFQLAF